MNAYPGTIDSTDGVTWKFVNWGEVTGYGDKKFPHCDYQDKTGGKTYKQAGLDGTPGTWFIAQFEEQGGSLEVDSGALEVGATCLSSTHALFGATCE